ncbi:putative quinol monooxygenase [Novosphingobium album (ex Liu et al. 2023)]|uniref:Antibiotic biosynthesis monooxygenase n=1 Tax=Novosphingobium album (ex Liu et al. 2023) TaxID=3031130 RepID=A0ABT5WX66_9SPHN|nr:antibiotic biosynthesis monooxygenase [Novosphingobium album (ex Liu et al. 2023)]MDE8654449.1 antibiotic biosynthesis monooxygenase [Novosphingobium album (ex Liu et al. 2023)]
MIIYSYEMTAQVGKASDLVQALRDMRSAMSGYNGLHSCKILRKSKNENEFRFTEDWQSIDDHDKSSGSVPKEVMERLRAALAGKPQLNIFEVLEEA